MALGPFIPRIDKPGTLRWVIRRANFLNGNIHVYWLPLQSQEDSGDPQYIAPVSSLYPVAGSILAHPKVIRLIAERSTNGEGDGGDFYADCSIDVSNDPFDTDTFTHFNGVAYSDPVGGQTVYSGFMTFPIASGVPAQQIDEVAALLVNGPGIADAIAAQVAAIADAKSMGYYGSPPFSINQTISFIVGSAGPWSVA